MKRVLLPLPVYGALCQCSARPLPHLPTQPLRRSCLPHPSAPTVLPHRGPCLPHPLAPTVLPHRPSCLPHPSALTAQLLEASPHPRGIGPTLSRTRGGLHLAPPHDPPFWLTPQASLPTQVVPGQYPPALPDRGPAAGSLPSHLPRPVLPADVPPCGSLLGIYLQESCVCVCSVGRGN